MEKEEKFPTQKQMEQKPAPQPVAVSKPSSDEQYSKGMELFKAGDYDAAFPLLEKSCPPIGLLKLKYPDGQAALGWMFENGCGTEVNLDNAYKRNTTNCGITYEIGRGTEKDYAKALYWYDRYEKTRGQAYF